MIEEQACYLIGVSLTGFGKILLHIRCHLYMTGDVRERPFNLKGGLWFFSKKIF
jgi:hypothetical protein